MLAYALIDFISARQNMQNCNVISFTNSFQLLAYFQVMMTVSASYATPRMAMHISLRYCFSIARAFCFAALYLHALHMGIALLMRL